MGSCSCKWRFQLGQAEAQSYHGRSIADASTQRLGRVEFGGRYVSQRAMSRPAKEREREREKQSIAQLALLFTALPAPYPTVQLAHSDTMLTSGLCRCPKKKEWMLLARIPCGRLHLPHSHSYNLHPPRGVFGHFKDAVQPIAMVPLAIRTAIS